jgi:hypothetical protein
MSLKVFYAWQSDTENGRNRSFIQKAAEGALKEIAKDFELEKSPRLDQATQDIAGMPDIAATILDKIDKASVFLADLTIVGTIGHCGRPTPNPNVLFELGYAVKRLGWQSVVPVMNTAYGKPEQQIFDIRGKRFWTYELDESANEDRKKQEKSRLAGQIRQAIKWILEEKESAIDGSVSRNQDAAHNLKQLLRSEDEIGLNDFIGEIAANLKEKLSDDRYGDWEHSISAEDVESRLDNYAADTDRLARLLAVGGRWGGPRHWRCWKDCIEKIADLPPLPSGWSSEFEISRCLRLYPALMCFYAGGLGALVGDKLDTLRFLFHEARVPFDHSLREPALALTPWEVFARGKHNYIVGNGQYVGLKAALSKLLYDKLPPIVNPLLNRSEDYSNFFDQFEFLLGLSNLELIERGVRGRDRRDALVGRFATLYEGSEFVSRMEVELGLQKDDWPPLRARLIDCSYQECEALMALYRKEVDLFRGNQRYGWRPNHT